MRNPISTKPTGPISIVVYESKTLERQTSKDEGNLKVVTSVPFEIPAGSASMSRSNLGAGLPSDFMFEMRLSHQVNTGGGILIKFPPEVQFDGNINVEIDASSYGHLTKLTKPEINYSARQIWFVVDAFKSDLEVSDSS